MSTSSGPSVGDMNAVYTDLCVLNSPSKLRLESGLRIEVTTDDVANELRASRADIAKVDLWCLAKAALLEGPQGRITTTVWTVNCDGSERSRSGTREWWKTHV
jgi:hypothetical protein